MSTQPQRDDSLTEAWYDAVFDALSNPCSRRALYRLCDATEPRSLVDLAEEIATREDRSTDECPSMDAEQVYLQLYHASVPKLVDVGIVEYDREVDVVELTDGVHNLEAYLALARRQEQPT